MLEKYFRLIYRIYMYFLGKINCVLLEGSEKKVG